jgi:tritrans,polycis-undecaprenyl-diphosphate synthase [geranylgeranyl-diphosphate specific]
MTNGAQHIGIILDGNRRFAKRLLKEPWRGHDFGAKKVGKLLEWCHESGVKELTLYAFSIQNFNRPKKEFDYLMGLIGEFFSDEKNVAKIHKNKVRVRFIGRISMFPKGVYKQMVELEEATKGYSEHTINFAMAYGGREEIIDGIKKLATDVAAGSVVVDDINQGMFRSYLELQNDPDLIIRTGGERRTSNFLMWQSSYSEWFFLDKFWPEFEKEDLVRVVEEFGQRDRRFGK